MSLFPRDQNHYDAEFGAAPMPRPVRFRRYRSNVVCGRVYGKNGLRVRSVLRSAASSWPRRSHSAHGARADDHISRWRRGRVGSLPLYPRKMHRDGHRSVGLHARARRRACRPLRSAQRQVIPNGRDRMKFPDTRSTSSMRRTSSAASPISIAVTREMRRVCRPKRPYCVSEHFLSDGRYVEARSAPSPR